MMHGPVSPIAIIAILILAIAIASIALLLLAIRFAYREFLNWIKGINK